MFVILWQKLRKFYVLYVNLFRRISWVQKNKLLSDLDGELFILTSERKNIENDGFFKGVPVRKLQSFKLRSPDPRKKVGNLIYSWNDSSRDDYIRLPIFHHWSIF